MGYFSENQIESQDKYLAVVIMALKINYCGDMRT